MPQATNPDGKLGNKPAQSARRPYSVLLPMGLAMPPALLPAR